VLWHPAWGSGTASQDVLDGTQVPSNVSTDPRSRIWYEGSSALGVALAGVANTSSPLYDKILIYNPGRVWDAASNSPGAPDWIAGGNFNQGTAEAEIAARRPGCDSVNTP
jgi:hypothetical protein